MKNKKAQTSRAYLPMLGALVLAAIAPLVQAQTSAASPTAAGALERVRAAGKITLGYYEDAQPMSYRGTNGQPAGYAVTLCQKIADDLKTQLQLPTLAAEWVSLTPANSVQALQQGNIDLLCTGTAATLTHREVVSFSAPIFPGGIGGLINVNAPKDFRNHLENRPEPYKPNWRGSAPAFLQHKTASVVAGTPAVELVAKGVSARKLVITLSTEESYAAGLTKVAKGKSDVLFGDRAQLLALAKQSPHAPNVKVLTRHFTYEPLALTLARNDDDFRLAVDRALMHFFALPQFGELYQITFGKADSDTVEFFRSLPR